ncbi:MAG: FIST N-terminal domain-containing protein [Phenylobacterium sp.]
MRASTFSYIDGRWAAPGGDADLVLWFAPVASIHTDETFAALRGLYPKAVLAGCSAQEAFEGGEPIDRPMAAALSFDKARVRAVEAPMRPGADPRVQGAALARALVEPDLRAVILLYAVAGPKQGAATAPEQPAAWTRGVAEALPAGVALFGCGASDSLATRDARVGIDRNPSGGVLAAIGLYGESLRVGCGVAHGWEPIGPMRRITRAEGNRIYEFDGRPALDSYLQYVGVDPQSYAGFNARYPLIVHDRDSGEDLPFVVAGLDEAEGALELSDSVPVGAMAQVGFGSFGRLIDASAEAARTALAACGPDAAVALSAICVIRKIALGQRILEEVEALNEETPGLPSLGLLAFGEVAPHARTGRGAFHTMSVAVAVLGEAA